MSLFFIIAETHTILYLCFSSSLFHEICRIQCDHAAATLCALKMLPPGGGAEETLKRKFPFPYILCNFEVTLSITYFTNQTAGKLWFIEVVLYLDLF